MSLLGIDVGTSGCKTAVFSETGQQLALAHEEYDYRHPQPGWAELDAPAVWELVKRTIRKAVAAAGADPVRGLSVSSMGEAVVPVTKQREIVGPSLLNFDVRGDEYLPDLGSRTTAERLYRINGNTLGSPYTVTKLIWLKHHQPDLYQRTDAFLHWGAFVSFMLGADACVDYSLANRTLLFDVDRGDWSDELLDWAGLDREKLPATVPAGAVIGTVSRAVAEELGLPVGIPIISGGHDQSCNAVGCGVIEPGSVMYGMGSFLCAVPVFSQRPDAQVMIERGLNTEHHVAPGQFVSFIYNQGGMLVKWFRDTYARAEALEAAETGKSVYPALFAELPDEPSRILVLPHFSITGPPRFISDSSGVIAGLKLETTRGEILKGIVEAATFYLRDCFEGLPGTGIAVNECTAAGGGSQSDAWVQLSADILGLPFVRLKVHEAGALGAAILAGAGSGQFATLRDGVDAMVHLKDRFEPDPARQRVYHDRFDRYRSFASSMETITRGMR
ncbi:MAG TPA: FGGY-family carbohydrate kinase [Anaerolineae bacterium]